MNSGKISASILTSKKLLYDIEIFESMGIDLLHIDWFVEEDISKKMNQIIDYSSIPLDFHVIGVKKGIVEEILRYNPKFCSLQHSEENEDEIIKIATSLKKNNIECGISLTIGDKTSILNKADFDYVMIMNTVPGLSGQKMNIKNSIEYIKVVKSLRPDIFIHIDGGIDDEMKRKYSSFDIRVFVCGSYLLKSENLYKNIIKLKGKSEILQKKVTNYIKKGNAFKIDKKETTKEIIKKLDSSKSGFLIIVDAGELYGVVTDGDIRRTILKPKMNLINQKPVFCLNEDTISNVFEKISKTEKHIEFVPVVDNSNTFLGFIDLNRIRGEINEF